MQVEEFLENSARWSPQKPALIVGTERVTYRQLDELANRFAHSLIRMGVSRGDRVVICLDNSIEAVATIFGTLKAGAVFVMASQGARIDKVLYLLKDCQAVVCVCSQKLWGQLRDHRSDVPDLRSLIVIGNEPEEGYGSSIGTVSFAECTTEPCTSGLPPKQCIDVDLAAIIYTSASSGNAKGVMLTHLNIVSAANSIISYLENRHDDIILNVLPLAFDYGLYQILKGIKIGGTVVLEKSFAYPHAVLNKIAQEKVTGFPLVPTMAALLLEMDLHKYDFSSLRYLTNTGAMLPTQHIVQLRKIFPQAKLFSMYGLTECKRVSYLPPEQLDIRPASVGRGMPNQEIYLVDEQGRKLGPGSTGELVVRGSHVMKGYWGLPEETARVLRPGGLWADEKVLHTGDVFNMDEEGYLYFVGRVDDIIKTRGKKVSPREIENMLHGIDAVAQAAVVGIPDPILGQAIKAVVRLKAGARLDERAIMQMCAERLEDYMVPKKVEIVRQFPLNEHGKIDKSKLQLDTPSLYMVGKEDVA